MSFTAEHQLAVHEFVPCAVLPYSFMHHSCCSLSVMLKCASLLSICLLAIPVQASCHCSCHTYTHSLHAWQHLLLMFLAQLLLLAIAPVNLQSCYHVHLSLYRHAPCWLLCKDVKGYGHCCHKNLDMTDVPHPIYSWNNKLIGIPSCVQAAYGQCNADWMVGFCHQSCNSC